MSRSASVGRFWASRNSPREYSISEMWKDSGSSSSRFASSSGAAARRSRLPKACAAQVADRIGATELEPVGQRQVERRGAVGLRGGQLPTQRTHPGHGSSGPRRARTATPRARGGRRGRRRSPALGRDGQRSRVCCWRRRSRPSRAPLRGAATPARAAPARPPRRPDGRCAPRGRTGGPGAVRPRRRARAPAPSSAQRDRRRVRASTTRCAGR